MEKPRFEKNEHQDSVVESRSGFSAAAREEFTRGIQSYIQQEMGKGHMPDERELEAKIYKYLTHRKITEELKKLEKTFSEKERFAYAELVEHTFQNLTQEGLFNMKGVDGGEPWTYAWYENKFAIPKRNLRVSEKESVDVHEKQYFTFAPLSKTHEGVYEEIQKFVNIVPELMAALRLFGLEHGDQIQLKIPNGILFLLAHPDTLVVHFNDKRNASAIRSIVQEVFDKHGVVITRKGRAEAGFDFRSNKGKYASLSGSHSELIAKAIAKDITHDFVQSDMFSVDKSNLFLKWFDGEVEAKGKLTSEEMLKYLVD